MECTPVKPNDLKEECILKRSRLTDIENKLVVTSGEGGNIGVGEWELQPIGCKIGYKDVLYNMRNIANIL